VALFIHSISSLFGIANTFTQQWELEPYYALANRYGIRVYSLIVENRHGGRISTGFLMR